MSFFGFLEKKIMQKIDVSEVFCLNGPSSWTKNLNIIKKIDLDDESQVLQQKFSFFVTTKTYQSACYVRIYGIVIHKASD